VNFSAAKTTEICHLASLIVDQKRQFPETAHAMDAVDTELHHGFLLFQEISAMDLKTGHDT
jgi:hypothetical protein